MIHEVERKALADIFGCRGRRAWPPGPKIRENSERRALRTRGKVHPNEGEKIGPEKEGTCMLTRGCRGEETLVHVFGLPCCFLSLPAGGSWVSWAGLCLPGCLVPAFVSLVPFNVFSFGARHLCAGTVPKTGEALSGIPRILVVFTVSGACMLLVDGDH